MCATALPTFRPRGPTLIAIGIGILIAAPWWPGLPVISAVAFVSFGATVATADRIRNLPNKSGLITIHTMLYVALYFLFVAAVFQMDLRPDHQRSLMRWADLAVSIAPMAAVLRRTIVTLLEDTGVARG
jgi:amino acid transporter